MAHLTFTARGTGGDIFPFVPIALELARRGHDCRFVVPPRMAFAISHTGLPVTRLPAAPEDGPSRAEDYVPMLFGMVAFDRYLRRITASLATTVTALRRQIGDTDLVITHNLHPAARTAAESEGVPWATLHLHPSYLPSRFGRPPALPAPAGALGRPAWWSLERAWRIRLATQVNDVRRANGLPPYRGQWLSYGVSDSLCLCLSHSFFVPAQPDWPRSAHAIGYPYWDTPRLAPGPGSLPDLDRPMVVFTLGTAGQDFPGNFYTAAASACAELGITGLILGRSATSAPGVRASPLLHLARYHPLSEILPRTSVLVHGGGVGATNAAFRWGRPTVVAYRCNDQVVNARRVAELGCGIAVPWRKVGSSLAPAIQRALTDRDMAVRIADIRRAATAVEPATLAADHIEQVLRTKSWAVGR